MSVSSAGPSYSIWLPWDHINGEEKEVTLLAVFKESGAGGRVSRSEQITALLPGKKSAFEKETDNLVESIRALEAKKHNLDKVGFEGTKPQGTKKIKSQEIKIPAGSRDRLFGTIPTVSYQVPQARATQASATEEIPSSQASQQSAGSSLDQLQARTGRFERQGKLPAGKQPPLLGVRSSAGELR